MTSPADLLLSVPITAFLVLFVPWKTTSAPLHALLNSAEDKKDDLTRTWRDQKLQELNYVGIAVSIAHHRNLWYNFRF